MYNRNKKDPENRKLAAEILIQQTPTKDIIMAENQLGVQTRSMMDTQHNNPEQLPVPNPTPTPNLDPQNTALNPVVEQTGLETDNLMEYIRTSSEINLDLYVPDLINTHIGDMIKNRLPTHTSRNHITVNCPMLKDIFSNSAF